MNAISKLPSKFSSLAVLAVALVVTGCVASGGAVGTAHDGPSAAPASPAPAGFYLQAWQTQALAPQNTFGWLPAVTIAGGQYVAGRVAVPMIYPGPLYTGLSERPISTNGVATVVAEARADGLLGDKVDFTATGLVGSVTAHIRLVVDGVTHDLTGPMPTDASTTFTAPGTASAFTAFWNRLGTIDTWLSAELGQSEAYAPASIAPLASPFYTYGAPFGGSVYRCAAVTGDDLSKLLPVVQASNVLTRFVDSTGAKMSLQVRVLLPGEASPCG